MRLPRQPVFVLLILATSGATLAACGGPSHAADLKAVHSTVTRSLTAENSGDSSTFLALWTDKGLSAYDAGSRQEIESGQVALGAEKTVFRDFSATTVKGNSATATVDEQSEVGLYRETFDLIRKGSGWLLDGFRFLGPSPAAPGTKVVDISAVDYGYQVDPSALSSGDFALHFSNDGKEQHEISILTLPPGTSPAQAILALGGFNGSDASTFPSGYGDLGHLAFAEPGDISTYSLANKLVPGTYAFACFLPVGGLDDSGNPKVPGSPTHLSRGMLAEFTVG